MFSQSNMFPQMSSEEAHELLAPYLQTLGECFYDAWRQLTDIRDQHPGKFYALTVRSQASYVNDHIWNNVKQRFAGVSNVNIVEQTNGLRLLCIAERLILRFKKLDRQLRSKNIRTRQQERIVKQLPLFDDMPAQIFLTMGYILDKLQTKIETVVVTLPVNNSIEWSFPIPPISPEIISLTSIAITDETQTRTRRVTLKESADDTKKRTGNE